MKKFIIVLSFGLLLIACNSIQKPADNLLEGTSWKLIYVQKHLVTDGITITAAFQDGAVSGSSGCNSYSGSYETDEKEISFGPLASTLMACMDPDDVMEQESQYLAWLQEAQTFSVTQGELMIFRHDGEALTFVPNSQ